MCVCNQKKYVAHMFRMSPKFSVEEKTRVNLWTGGAKRVNTGLIEFNFFFQTMYWYLIY